AIAGDVAPFVNSRLTDRTIGAGQNTNFRIRGVGSFPLAYQWRKEGVAIAGATSSVMPLLNVQPSDAGNYSVVISNAFGIVTSSIASLTVTATPPVIESQPASQEIAPGNTATFTVSVVGAQPFAYQWQWFSTNLPGATEASLVITNAQFTNSGPYRVAITNAFGFALSSNANLTVFTSLADALDTTGLTWTTSGDANWFGQPQISHDGVDAAQSGAITHNQQSTLQTTISGPGNLSFWWKVSSETFWDTLVFNVNGVESARISGEINWQQRVFSIPSGSQTLQWV